MSTLTTTAGPDARALTRGRGAPSSGGAGR